MSLGAWMAKKSHYFRASYNEKHFRSQKNAAEYNMLLDSLLKIKFSLYVNEQVNTKQEQHLRL